MVCGVQTHLFLTLGLIKDYFKVTAKIHAPHGTASLPHSFLPPNGRGKMRENKQVFLSGT